jgi:predicted Rossmann-fold nucleotide-binding protein
MRNFKIGVFGSAGSLGEDNSIEKYQRQAFEIGQLIATHKHILVNGACSGLPYFAALGAKQAGGKVWGFPAATNLKMLQQTVKECDVSTYTKLFFVPKNLTYLKKDVAVMRKFRNVASTAQCDAGIIISGKWGTMHEFIGLYDTGKVIGVLAGSGGVAQELPKLIKVINKPTQAKIIFEKSPKKLIQKVIDALI